MPYTVVDKASLYFNTVLYTGDGTNSKAITGVGFQPDWLWIKIRAGSAQEHVLVDAVRGATKSLESETTDAEETTSNTVASLNSDGFTLGTTPRNRVNQSASTYASWNWKANGTGSSNTAGTITSTVSANTTSGFSIVSWTTPASGNFTVGHGLGVTPSMVIIKVTTQTGDWWVYHKGLGVNTTDYLSLNQTIAESSATSMWGSTGMTSTLCGFGAGVSAYSNNPMIAYCFAEIKGYSKFGSYTGNGSADGTYVHLGFRPAFVVIKRSDTSGYGWYMFDNKRNTFNPEDKILETQSSTAEYTGTVMDFTSNGFKLRNSGSDVNPSGGTIIYMAFADQPFVSSKGIVANAR